MSRLGAINRGVTNAAKKGLSLVWNKVSGRTKWRKNGA